MKKVGYVALLLVVVIILIPLIILNGVGGEKAYRKENGKNGQTAGNGAQNNKDDSNDPLLSSDGNQELKVKVFIAGKNELKEMQLEEYIRGVVCAEMPAEFDMEALKAQAVAARTYTVTRMRQFGGTGCSRNKDADICTDHTHCQAWISKEDRFKSWNSLDAQKYWDKVTKAVEDTKGLILVYDSVPVMYPLYFSTSSGKTENSQEIFKTSEPYLRSVVSPNEEEAPKFVSKVDFTISDFVKRFADSEYKIKLDKTKLKSQVRILSRTEGGSVKSIQVGSKTLTGTEVRKILDLNSANFTVNITSTGVTFTVLGNGHGVGMSQWGANEMGKRNSTFEDILKHYYNGVQIVKLQDIFKIK